MLHNKFREYHPSLAGDRVQNYPIETENDKQNLINCLRAIEQHNKDYPEEYLEKFIKYLQTHKYNEYVQKLFFILKDYVTADQAIDIVKATFVDD